MSNMTNTGKVMVPVPIAARNSDGGRRQRRVVEKDGQLPGKRNVAIEAGDCWCDMWRMKVIVAKWRVGHAPNMRNALRDVQRKRGHLGLYGGTQAKDRLRMRERVNPTHIIPMCWR